MQDDRCELIKEIAERLRDEKNEEPIFNYGDRDESN